jgi:hypothetical protein
VNPSTLASLPSHLESGFIERKSSSLGGVDTRGMTKAVWAPKGLDSATTVQGKIKIKKKRRAQLTSFIRQSNHHAYAFWADGM